MTWAPKPTSTGEERVFRFLPPETLADGRVLRLSEIECGDCGFLSGIASVTWPSGLRRELTGAGCKQHPRRDLSVARAWALAQKEPT